MTLVNRFFCLFWQDFFFKKFKFPVGLDFSLLLFFSFFAFRLLDSCATVSKGQVRVCHPYWVGGQVQCCIRLNHLSMNYLRVDQTEQLICRASL